VFASCLKDDLAWVQSTLKKRSIRIHRPQPRRQGCGRDADQDQPMTSGRPGLAWSRRRKTYPDRVDECTMSWSSWATSASKTAALRGDGVG
jgi:hypothetical protein